MTAKQELLLDNGDNDPIVDIEYLNKEMVRESAEGRTMLGIVGAYLMNFWVCVPSVSI